MMTGIKTLVEANGISLDINNHRHMVDILLKGNTMFTDGVNQSIFNLVQTYICESKRFWK